MNKDYALQYLEMNLSIFPTKGKKPLVAWKQYISALPSKEQIESWWTQWPDADIGCVTGTISNIVVVDIDGGKIPYLPTTVYSQTSPDHFQYFFKYPNLPVTNSVKQIADNIDIRGDGGFAVLPPSRHFNKKTGEQDFIYKWINDPKETRFVDLPLWLLKKKEWKPIEKIVQGSVEGSRNNDAASIIGSLLVKYPQYAWESICWPLLEAWNTKNQPPLELKELRTVFDSISKRELSKSLDNTFPRDVSKETVTAETNNQPLILEWDDFINQEQVEEPWLIENLLRPGWLAVLGGHGKQGKTTLSMHMLNALRLGTDFLYPCKSVPVIHLNFEMANNDMRELMKAVTSNFGAKGENAKIINQPACPLDYKWLEEQLDKQSPGVCVIDSFRAAFMLANDAENQAGTVGGLLRKLQGLARKTGWTILIIHHFNKKGQGEALDLSGSGEWLSAPDVIFAWNCPKMNEAGKFTITGRIPPIEPLSVKLSRESVEFLGTIKENWADDQREQVFNTLKNDWITTEEIKKAVNLPESTIRQRLTELYKEARIDRKGKGVRGDAHLWKLAEKNYSAINLTKNNPRENESNQTERAIKNTPEITIEPCYCGSKKFWRTKFRNIVCAICHPPSSKDEVVKWINLEEKN